MAVAQCEKDFDAVIERMLNLNLDAAGAEPDPPAQQQLQPAATGPGGNNNIGAGLSYWAETLVSEVFGADTLGDARERVRAVLEAFGGAVDASARAGAASRMDAASRESAVLKRAVLYHYRLLKAERKAQEQLRMQVYDYGERVRRLEASNYALTLHLRQAELHHAGGGAMPPGPRNPEIF
uniref:Uncharacterized protein n=1 Tax=Leersia perrieri TaxID=77586 RepID=A0A0D9V2S7_9ORYZ